MRKIFILLMLFIVSTSNAIPIEVCYYSNFTSYKMLINNNWTDWTDWKEYYVEIVFDTDSNAITIYDENIKKVYKIHPIYEKSEDSNSVTIKYKSSRIRK